MGMEITLLADKPVPGGVEYLLVAAFEVVLFARNHTGLEPSS